MMKSFIFKMPRKIVFILAMTFLLIFLGKNSELGSVGKGKNQEQEAGKARMYRDVYPLISESDLYGSFFVLEKKEMPDTKIVESERGEKIVLMREQDIFYINKGNESGLEPGQVFLILELGRKIKSPFKKENLGRLALKRGKAQVVAVGSNRASARIEKAYGQIKVGNFLVPYEEKTGLLGKDLGFEDFQFEGEGSGGVLIYLQNDYGRIASGQWAIIDLGEEDGLQFGQQLVAFRISREAVTPKILGNLIVIDTQRKTSTVKVLSCSDILKLGDRVRTR